MSEAYREGEVRAPVPPPDARRRYPRVSFVTAVELQTAHSIEYGFSENISEGGMLVRSQASLSPMQPVLATFVLRGTGRMQIESRVVHCRPGVRAGIEFVSMSDEQRTILRQFAQPTIMSARRSARIPVRLFLDLSWVACGQMLGAQAETVLISQHGCLVLTRADLDVGASVSLRWPDAGIGARARVVSRQDCAADLPRVAMEFVSTDAFWGEYFPADS